MENESIQVARSYIENSDQLSDDELLDALLNFRTQSHPDRFTDDEAKEIATERFKVAQEAIDQLERKRQRDLIAKPHSSLTVASPTKESLRLKLEINAEQKRFEELQKKFRKLSKDHLALKNELQAERDAKRKEELEALGKIYEPSRGRIVGVAIAVLLTGAVAAIGQVGSIGESIQKFSPIAPWLLNIAIFLTCMAIAGATLFRFLKHSAFTAMMNETSTTRFATEFLKEIRRERRHWDHDDDHSDGPLRFNESSVIEFVRHYFTASELKRDPYYYLRVEPEKKEVGGSRFRRAFEAVLKPLKTPRYTYRRALGLLGTSAIDHLKDAFIFHLIHRRLIDDPRSEFLVHQFEVKGSSQAE
tara:strand:- start:12416 stop:13495 length:1080 start_codon:yes stop_codon:yes gene_type:complete